MDSDVAIFEADLHCHTTASDGLLTPTELVLAAAELGLKGVGLTDHDTIQGWKEAEGAGVSCNIQVLKGIEINTDWHGKEVHILGYEMNSNSHSFNDMLKRLRQAREKRMLEILDRLKKIGIYIKSSEVQQFAQGESVGRPHIAEALKKAGYVNSVREAFDRFIGIGAPAYVPSFKLTTEEGIRFIRRAQGVAVLAHPGIQGLAGGVPDWVKAGLQGIEVFHSEHSPVDVKIFGRLAKEYDLLTTGGSDFHGEERKPGVKLGHWGVPFAVLEQIRTLAGRNQDRER